MAPGAYQRVAVFLRRHSESIERAAPSRHADHDGEFGPAYQIDGRASIAEHLIDFKQFVSGFVASTAEIASVIVVASRDRSAMRRAWA